jgi:hypothetical protein
MASQRKITPSAVAMTGGRESSVGVAAVAGSSRTIVLIDAACARSASAAARRSERLA